MIDLFMNIFSEKRAMTTYLTASIGGIVAFALLIFTIYIFTKYRFVGLKHFPVIIILISE